MVLDMNYSDVLKEFKERRAKVVALVAKGMTQADIARQLKITPQRVNAILQSERQRK